MNTRHFLFFLLLIVFYLAIVLMGLMFKPSPAPDPSCDIKVMLQQTHGRDYFFIRAIGSDLNEQTCNKAIQEINSMPAFMAVRDSYSPEGKEVCTIQRYGLFLQFYDPNSTGMFGACQKQIDKKTA